MSTPEPRGAVRLGQLAAAARETAGVGDATALVLPAGASPDVPATVKEWLIPDVRAVSADAGSTAAGARQPALVHGPGGEPGPGWPRTLQEALRNAAASSGDRGTTYLMADGSVRRQTYRELLHDAQNVLHGMREAGLVPGDCVLVQCDDNQNFITVFWACVLGGFLPTPIRVASDYRRDNAATRRLSSAYQLLDQPLIITDRELMPEVVHLRSLWDAASVRVASVEDLAAGPEATDWFPATPDDLVLNLLTSGSSGAPKCVQHPNRTVAYRTWAGCAAGGFGPEDVSLNWMPLDHVGGMIMMNVRDTFVGSEHVNARTDAFLAHPVRWLAWADQWRVTNTWAPNFAFALVNDQQAEIRSASWNLSRLRHIVNGGEAVVSQTAHRFLDLLTPHGLPADAIVPTWGMSETCSGVTHSRLKAGHPAVGTITVNGTSMTGDLEMVTPGPGTVTFTEVGQPMAGVSFRVVDDQDRVLPEGRIGRLQVTGSTVMSGYRSNPAANAESFTDDGWFDTGDLAFLRDGRLTLTGRAKDQIVVNGANFPHYDIESVVEKIPGVEVTWVAACALHDPGHRTDRLAIFFVPAAASLATPRSTVDAIRDAIAREVGIQPDVIVPVPRDRFPKTSSGKIQRAALAKALVAGEFCGDRGTTAHSLMTAHSLVTKAWQPAPLESGPLPRGAYLLYEDETGELSKALRQRLGAGCPVVPVLPGGTFTVDGLCVTVDPADAGHHDRVLDILAGLGVPLAAVVHAWARAPWPDSAPPDGVDPGLGLGVVSVLLLLQALNRHRVSSAVTVVMSASGAWTRPGDLVDVRKAALSGLVRTAAVEDVSGRIVHLDVSAGADPTSVADSLMAELAVGDHAKVVAVREGLRLVPRLRLADGPARGASSGITPGGCYLMTGGLGGIGFELAQYLEAAYQIRLLVIGRHTAQDGERAARLAELAAIGDARYLQCDVADAEALLAGVAAAEREWRRPLDGVLHLAGERMDWDDVGAHALARESVPAMLATLRPKVGGTRAIESLLAARPNATAILFSSVNGFFGAASFAAYAAASSALDGAAEAWAGTTGRDVRCLAWSMWDEVGMSRGNPLAAAAMRRGFQIIEPTSGLESFLHALARPEPYLLIGLDSSNPHVQHAFDHEVMPGSDVVVAVCPAQDGADLKSLADEVNRRLSAQVSFFAGRVVALPRSAGGRFDPEALLTALQHANRTGWEPEDFEEPAGVLENEVARMWLEMLGVPRVGRSDSFFTLGGNSILATQMMARVNDQLHTAHPIRLLYEYSTLRSFAAVLAGS